MSVLGLECAPKRTLASASELMGSRPRQHRRRGGLIRPTGKWRLPVMRNLPVVPLCRRPAALFKTPNQQHPSPCPAPARGAYRDRHGRWARDAMDAAAAQDEWRCRRTAKSCGPGAPTLASSWRKQFRRRRWQESPVTGESAKETVKTIAQGMPVDAALPVATTLVCFFQFAREAMGASSAPGIPCALLVGGWIDDVSLGRYCREIAMARLRE